MSSALDDRYDGRPFLKLLDSYVLWAAGELEPENELALVKMTPKLQEVYASSGSWQEIVEAQMDLPDSAAASIKAMWSRNLARVETAGEHGEHLDAGEWARRVVDENFMK